MTNTATQTAPTANCNTPTRNKTVKIQLGKRAAELAAADSGSAVNVGRNLAWDALIKRGRDGSIIAQASYKEPEPTIEFAGCLFRLNRENNTTTKEEEVVYVGGFKYILEGRLVDDEDEDED